MPWSHEQPRSHAWVAQVKRNAQGRCEIRYDGCLGTADIADHIVPIEEGGAVDDPANGQGACRHCHKIKTAAETKRGRQRMFARAKHPRERHPGLI